MRCSNASSTLGEIIAIRMALEIAAIDRYDRCVILTDSLTKCNALNSGDSINYLVTKYFKKVMWFGFLRAEVDLLAKQASEFGAPVVEDFSPK